MIKLKIDVTKEILEESKYAGIGPFSYLNESCAIACALRQVFPEARVSDRIYLDGDTNNYEDSVKIPDKAVQFIARFDDNDIDERAEMDPISFEVEVPDKVINQIDISDALPKAKNLSLVKS